MTFYTYMWLREDGTPYYVGKGMGNRAFRKSRKGCPPRDRILIQEWSTEEEAYEAEKLLISIYGRKNNGTGILRNNTDGGAGGGLGNQNGLGGQWSEEQRKRQSRRLRGNRRSFGIRFTLTQEQRDKIAAANRLRKGEVRRKKIVSASF